MGKITLQQAADWCGGTIDPKYAEVEFLGANNDTRILQPGQPVEAGAADHRQVDSRPFHAISP